MPTIKERAAIKPSLPRKDPTLSYWQDPPDEIAGVRTSTNLPEDADYVIIGSGISGALIAFGLLEKKPNAKIVMLEARGACSGASGRNGGHTKAGSYRAFPKLLERYGKEEALKIVQLEYDNIVATHAFAAKYDIACESRACDTVDIVYDKATFDDGVEAVKLIQENLGTTAGIGRYAIYDADAARREFLTPGEDVCGAITYAAGSISAYRFGVGILKMCLKLGLNLQTFTPAEAISSSEGIWTAKTPRGEIMTPNLILATNGYSAQLLPQLQGKIVPIRGQVTAHRSGPKISKLRPQGLDTTYSFIYRNGYEYMIPRPFLPSTPEHLSGDIVIGGGIGKLPNEGLSEYGETDDTVLNSNNSAYLHQTTKTYFGENWGDDHPTERVRNDWTGIMGFTGDGHPLVGELPGKKGLWISAGFNGHGMVLCLKCAEALTHMLLDIGTEVFGTWFPSSFAITEERLEEMVFKGYITTASEQTGGK
ncbi:FAD dependent oxidoreductase [Tothia fuscella]|uniref:FAD dependent oxidoreductase n=1 Tax=Tothia fuscella TaxID=1048955 RepID=A0A9P4U147_9PEZI|nr:FAD dependent oxidoreductase [Tothia fuscella]